jgi:hypothetical protein
MNCNFKIITPIGYNPKLSYVSFVTEFNYDFWRVYDGPNSGSRLISSTSGNVAPSISYGTNREMYITWNTDGSVVSSGVVAYLDFVIPASISPTSSLSPSFSVSPTTTLSSSSSGSRTVSSTKSSSISPTKTITQSLTSSISQSPSTTKSPSITSTITSTISGSSSVTNSVTSSVSPSQTQTKTVSVSKTISPTPSPYHIFTCDDPESIRHSIDYKSYISTNLQDVYKVNMSCSFVVIAPREYAVKLSYLRFNTEPNYDFWSVYDGENHLIQRVSGPIIPKQSIVYSTGRIMTIKWNSDESINENGVEVLVDFIVASPSPTSSATVSLSPTSSATVSLSPTSSATVSLTSTNTISSTISSSISITPTTSITSSNSITPTTSITSSGSTTVSVSVTPTNSITASVSVTSSSSITSSVSVTSSSSVTSTTSITSSVSTTISITPTVSISITPTVSISITPTTSITSSVSVTSSSSITVTSSSTITPSVTITSSSTKTPSNTVSQSSSLTPSSTPTPSSTKTPSNTVTITSTKTITTSSSVSPSITTSSSVSPSTTVSSSVTTSPSISPSRTMSVTSRATNSPIPIIALPSRPPKPQNVSENFIQEITIPITEILSAFNFSDALANSDTPVLMSYESELGQVLLQAQPVGLPYSFDFSTLNSDSTTGMSPSIVIPASDTPKIVEVSLVSSSDFLALLPESSQENLTSSILSISQYNLDGSPLSVSSAFNFTLPMSSISGENTTAQCIYLDRTSGNWSSDGCVSYDYSEAGYVLCSCSHMTEFASRFAAIADMNEAIFEILLQQLQKPFIWIVVGSIIITFLILSFISFRLDEKSYYKYLHYLKMNPEIQFIETHYNQYIYYSPIMNDKKLLNIKFDTESNFSQIKTDEAPFNSRGFWTYLKICSRRIPYKHSYFTWIFAFDPLFPRTYRLMFLISGLITSLFTTALLYGYKSGSSSIGSELPPLEFSETVILSLMTSGINIPIMKFFKYMIDYSSKLEYKFRFPKLYEEMQNRMSYEKTIHSKPLRSNKIDITNRLNDLQYVRLLNKLGLTPSFENLEIFKKNLNSLYNFVDIDNIKIEPPNIDTRPKKINCIHKYLVLHTKASIGTLALIFSWLAWCLFFFISFGLYQKEESINSLMQTFGQTQGVQIFVIQPLSLMIILWILNKVKHLQEKYCHKKSNSSFIEVSNPMKNKYSTMLSNSFGHMLYVHIPAKCSQKLFDTSKIPIDLILAPNKAVSEFIEHHNKVENIYSSREMTILSMYYIEKLL